MWELIVRYEVMHEEDSFDMDAWLGMRNEEMDYFTVLIKKRYHERRLDYGFIRNLEFYEKNLIERVSI
jgi:hypothetical protein